MKVVMCKVLQVRRGAPKSIERGSFSPYLKAGNVSIKANSGWKDGSETFSDAERR